MSEKTNTPKQVTVFRRVVASVEKHDYSCKPDSLPPSSASQSVEQAREVLADFIEAELSGPLNRYERGDLDANLDALIAAVDASAYARGRADAGQSGECVWTVDGLDSEIWSSSCGEDWTFITDGPKENRVTFCHHCGQRVRVADAGQEVP